MTAINQITRLDVEVFRLISGGEDVATPYDNHLDGYQALATKSAIYPGQGTPLGLVYVALKLNGEAGEFAEHVGKAMRDDGMLGSYINDHGSNAIDWHEGPNAERRDLLIKEIGDVLWYLSAACNELGISLSEAATINLEKLCDRAERNALRGSGDNR